MEDFEDIAPFKVRCKNCGAILETGILNLSDHWAACGGKDFYNALMELAKKSQLTEENLDRLKDTPF